MRDAVHKAIAEGNVDVLVMSAAVADFRPATPAAQKLKKSSGKTSESAAEDEDWSRLTADQFLEGYSDKDAIYDED